MMSIIEARAIAHTTNLELKSHAPVTYDLASLTLACNGEHAEADRAAALATQMRYVLASEAFQRFCCDNELELRIVR